MKVLQLHNVYRNSGGEDAVVQSEYQLLADKGVEVQQLLFHNDQIKAQRFFRNDLSRKRTSEIIVNFKPDLIHVHNIFYEGTPAVLEVAKSFELPVVMTLHNFRLICSSALLMRKGQICTKCKSLKFPAYGIRHRCFQNSFTKSAMLAMLLGQANMSGFWEKHIDRLLVLTPFIHEIFTNSGLVFPSERIVVKANSTNDLNEQNLNPGKRKDFVFVGRLSEEKGIRTLIEGFKLRPEFKLRIIGTGPLLEYAQNLSGDNVEFLGRQSRENTANYIGSAKALILPSICFEGLPNTLMEAFSAGTPVIASDNGNLRSLIRPGINGEIFEMGSAEALALCLNNFIDNFPGTYSINARRTYEQFYTHEANFNALTSIYNELVSP